MFERRAAHDDIPQASCTKDCENRSERVSWNGQQSGEFIRLQT